MRKFLPLFALVTFNPFFAHADVIYAAHPSADTYNLVFTPASGVATTMTISGSNEVSITVSGVLVQYYWYNVVETTTAGASEPLISYLEARNPASPPVPSTFDFNFNGIDSAYTGGSFMNLATPNQPLTPGTYNLNYDPTDSTGTYSTGTATLKITDLTAIPETPSLILLATGIVGAAAAARRKSAGSPPKMSIASQN